MGTLAAIAKHVWTEPRFKAATEWGYEHSVSRQIEEQVGREAMQTYVLTGRWPDPNAEVVIELAEEPDWDWWEPTSQWRRKAARDRELDALLSA